MHYNPYGFAVNPNYPTLTPLDKNNFYTIGQRGGPSFLDIQAINLAYQCEKKCTNKLNCKNHGYQNPNDCTSCICPSGTSGILCDQVQYSTCGAKIQVWSNYFFIKYQKI
jgi:astacin